MVPALLLLLLWLLYADYLFVTFFVILPPHLELFRVRMGISALQASPLSLLTFSTVLHVHVWWSTAGDVTLVTDPS